MSSNNLKLPKKGGAKKAAEAIKKFRDQEPSDRLIKIISEYGNDLAVDKEPTPKRTLVAAKDTEL